jgi:hypothetical protein
MNPSIDAAIESRLRATVKLGDPFALGELLANVCGDDVERSMASEVIADEYRRRLAAMPREEMLEVYRRHYQDASDANKDWLLGEIVESIEAERS